MDDFNLVEILESTQLNSNWEISTFDQQDAVYLSSSRQMLEPILEETSEDEESSMQSNYPYENGAWSSESETGSVIRIELGADQDSISERGLACPAKRARHDLDCNVLLNSITSQTVPNNQLLKSSLPILPIPVSATTNSTNSFNNYSCSNISSNATPSLGSSNNNYCNTISGLVDSPLNSRKLRNNNESFAIGSLLDSQITELPILRKRLDDFNIYSDSDSLSYNSLSRSSSLIQFESLERQLQNDLSSISAGSSPSLLSFDTTSENISNNLNHRGSNGSLKRFESSDSRLHQTYFDLDKIDFDKNTPSLLFRSSRTLSEDRQSKSDSESSSDNSILSHEERILVRPADTLSNTTKHLIDPNKRLYNTVGASTRSKNSTENLSEDSGYCEQYQPIRTKSKSISYFEKFCEEDEFQSHRSLENIYCNTLPSKLSIKSSEKSYLSTPKNKFSPHNMKADTKKQFAQNLQTQKNENIALDKKTEQFCEEKTRKDISSNSLAIDLKEGYCKTLDHNKQVNKNCFGKKIINNIYIDDHYNKTSTPASYLNSSLYSQLSTNSGGACAVKENNMFSHSALSIPPFSSYQSKLGPLRSSTTQLAFKKTSFEEFVLNSNVRTYFSSLPDVRQENSHGKDDPNIHDDHKLTANCEQYNAIKFVKNSVKRKKFNKVEYKCNDPTYKINYENVNANSQSIATQNKIFRIDCVSPENTHLSFINVENPISFKSRFLLNKSLSSDELNTALYLKSKKEDSLLDDKYLTESSSVPNNINLLGSDIHIKNYRRSSISSSETLNNHTNKRENIVEKQFCLHNPDSSSSENFSDFNKDNYCGANYNNKIPPQSEKLYLNEFQNWNETTVIESNRNDGYDKQACNGTFKNLINRKRWSGEFCDSPNSNTVAKSGLNFINASYQDLTKLNYNSTARNSCLSIDSSNLKRGSREMISSKSNVIASSKTEISKGNYLLDEISENFDKNLSIMAKEPDNMNQLKQFVESEKPCPPIRNKANKDSKLDTSPDVVHPPIKKPPRRHIKHKQFEHKPKTFDEDPSILKTTYTESLERCNFDPKEISTNDIAEAIKNCRKPISSPHLKRSFVASTPNLHSFKIDKADEDFDDLKTSSASNSMQRLPQDKKLGILVSSSSKQSLGKSVNFCPVIAEYKWRERSTSSSCEQDSLEEVNDSILLANTVANENYNCNINYKNILNSDVDCKNVQTNKNNNYNDTCKVLRETNFEWHAHHENNFDSPEILLMSKLNEKKQEVIATLLNKETANKASFVATTNISTATSHIPIVLKTVFPNESSAQNTNTDSKEKTKNYISTNAIASGESYRNVGDGVEEESNGFRNIAVTGSENDKINNRDDLDGVNKQNSNSYVNKDKDFKPTPPQYYRDNTIKMDMQKEVRGANGQSLNNMINLNIENSIIDRSSQTEEILNNNDLNYESNRSKLNIDSVTKTTKYKTTHIKKVQNSSKSNSMPSIKTYSSAGNSPQSAVGFKPEYTQNAHLATTVPLNPANSHELLNSKLKGKASDKNKSFLSRFAGNLRFSLRRKPKKTLPNEPMPACVAGQQHKMVKSGINIFGLKKKSIADGAVKSSASLSNPSLKSATIDSSDFIYIPLKGSTPKNINERPASEHAGNIENNISQKQFDNSYVQKTTAQELNNVESANDNNQIVQVKGKPPLPKQPPRVIIGEKGLQYQQRINNSNQTKIKSEDALSSTINQSAGPKTAHNNGEFIRNEIRLLSQPRDGCRTNSNNAGNILGKFVDNERFFYSTDYQLDETSHGNGLRDYNNENIMNISEKGIQQNGINLNTNNICKNGTDASEHVYNRDYVPPPTQFTDEKPPSGKIRKNSGGSLFNKNKIGLIETNLDTHETSISGKTQSLMELGPNISKKNFTTNNALRQQNDQIHDNDEGDVNVDVKKHHLHHNSIRRPHKSMEFLLDKENQKNAAPPENELQKSHDNTTALSEHQLRVQASLQRLNIPDWYRAYSSTSKTGVENNTNTTQSSYKPGSFTRKRASDSGRWIGLNSKTTSLSSLGSQRSDRSPILLSPSAHSHHGATTDPAIGAASTCGGFSRWSTSHLNSTQTSPCTSQRGSFSRGAPINSSFSSVGCSGSAASGNFSGLRSSFRQPYMGWRSQEKINQPRTPHERLASTILSAKLSKTDQGVTPEIQSSIKEVTSAIVHHFNDQNKQSASHSARSRSTSPNSRKCWLESSFVGVRPLESPQTPTIETNNFVNSAPSALASTSIDHQQQLQRGQPMPSQYNQQINLVNNTQENYDPVSTFRTHLNKPSHHYQQPQHQLTESDMIRFNGVVPTSLAAFSTTLERSPSSASLEDVLASLLGLPPTDTSNTYRSTDDSANAMAIHRIINDSQTQEQQMNKKVIPNNNLQVIDQQNRLRRRSEGDAQKQKQHIKTEDKSEKSADISIQQPNAQQNKPQQRMEPTRRVSLDSSESKGTSEIAVKCRNTKCDNAATPVDAKKIYKSCHNCSHLYCSRECRRAHWEKHRKACLHSRVSNLCRQVLSACKDDLDSLRHLSLLARKGYLAQGRGVVRILFRSPESAEGFIKSGFQCMGEASYVRWPDLMPAEMGLELYSELLRLSTEYKPETKMLIYVAICVVSEAPGTAAAPVKWERQLVSRCAKLKLCKTIISELAGDQNQQLTATESSIEIIILTFDCHKKTTQSQKDIILQNIINVLSRKGVILKKHYPEIYQRLQTFAEGQTERFLPVTLHPRDATTGQGFVCIIMPAYNETDMQMPTSDIGNRVTTIDIGEELLES